METVFCSSIKSLLIYQSFITISTFAINILYNKRQLSTNWIQNQRKNRSQRSEV